MKILFKILLILTIIILADYFIRYNIVKLDGFSGEILGLLEKTDTKYSINYSHSKFGQIKMRMSEKEVIGILGEPLDRWQPYFSNSNFKEKSHYTGFIYSESPSSTHYRVRQVYFDNGKVAEIISYFYID